MVQLHRDGGQSRQVWFRDTGKNMSKTWVKYDIVHMLDQAFSKQPLIEFGSLLKMTPKQVSAQF